MVSGKLLHRTYYEGDDDGTILLALASGGLLPADLDVVQKAHRKNNPGKDGMVKDVAAIVNPVGGPGLSAVAVRDMDELSPDQVRDWFVQRLSGELPQSTPSIQVIVQSGSVRVWHLRIEVAGMAQAARAIIVSAGVPGGIAARDYGVSQFAMDDHILQLAREKKVYESVPEFSEVSYDMAMKKLSEIVALMKNNGVPIKHTKRLMHILRAVTGFRASPSTFADRIVKQGIAVLGSSQVRNIFLPLIESLEEASRLLTP